ncbi:uncharacterized protein CC84DRAFT_1239892 [Paraphaeosphaeria sporulosa]|uniref:Uncharacterized protein n=1 Tax=Paraphaeosphaeria sporulosa TaxID=1460663 RepID=A0A177CNP2_9PLEO|nr:uncharacterized protein CC84DRAFT_1239892 [Paraphaeosphaeria sporulosa]OAG08602.1 hypothetical protein CC84DRAFT_1239892 [Paraphaeosphaeria sporulosa]
MCLWSIKMPAEAEELILTQTSQGIQGGLRAQRTAVGCVFGDGQGGASKHEVQHARQWRASTGNQRIAGPTVHCSSADASTTGAVLNDHPEVPVVKYRNILLPSGIETTPNIPARRRTHSHHSGTSQTFGGGCCSASVSPSSMVARDTATALDRLSTLYTGHVIRTRVSPAAVPREASSGNPEYQACIGVVHEFACFDVSWIQTAEWLCRKAPSVATRTARQH